MRLVSVLFGAISLLNIACVSEGVSSEAESGLFQFEFEELVPGVWAGVRSDSPRFPVMGSTTFVITDDGVVVYDGGGAAAMADQTIEKIKSLTDAPVTHVIISHWHGDHHFGAFRFQEEYPGAKYITHDFTERALNGSPINYFDTRATFFERNLPFLTSVVEDGVDLDGNEVREIDRDAYAMALRYADEFDREFKRMKLVLPDYSFDSEMVIQSGNRRIELLFLGHGNTEGDIVMWLPDEKIVATGDLVVHPSPYAFNVPPRAWAETLKRLNELGYAKLVPGHGDVQSDTAYVDLIIETAESIADQRDAMAATGMSNDEIQESLDFTAFEERFTGGDPYLTHYYHAYFEGPFRAAAIKEMSGEPMVVIGPRATPENASE